MDIGLNLLKMKKFALILILIFSVACSKYEDVPCYVISYIEVDGQKIKVDEFKCGCFPTSSPDGEETFEYEGAEYPITKELSCI